MYNDVEIVHLSPYSIDRDTNWIELIIVFYSRYVKIMDTTSLLHHDLLAMPRVIENRLLPCICVNFIGALQVTMLYFVRGKKKADFIINRFCLDLRISFKRIELHM